MILFITQHKYFLQKRKKNTNLFRNLIGINPKTSKDIIIAQTKNRFNRMLSAEDILNNIKSDKQKQNQFLPHNVLSKRINCIPKIHFLFLMNDFIFISVDMKIIITKM